MDGWLFSEPVHVVKYWFLVTVCFVMQQAANIVRALELFVKPDVLSGENAYMCAKYVHISIYKTITVFIWISSRKKRCTPVNEWIMLTLWYKQSC